MLHNHVILHPWTPDDGATARELCLEAMSEAGLPDRQDPMSWTDYPEPVRREVLATMRVVALDMERHADRCGAGTEAERDHRERAGAMRAAIAELGHHVAPAVTAARPVTDPVRAA